MLDIDLLAGGRLPPLPAAFLDGRDTPPRSTLEYLAKLDRIMQEVGGCRIGTVMSRLHGARQRLRKILQDDLQNLLH